MTQPVYLSQEKFDALSKELEHRKTVTRKDIAEKIGIAKDQGDLSENFEYQTAKDWQAENESEIFKLDEMLHNAVIVESESGRDTVALGSTFSVRMPNGTERTFQLVGATESNPMEGKISNESPLGNAFLGAKVNETVNVAMPGGDVAYTIVSIS